MNIKFKTNKADWKKYSRAEIILHFSAFQDFMLQFEEHMTFSEAEKYWNKYEQLSDYILKTYGINAEEEVRNNLCKYIMEYSA